jgi:hypothetical protein
MSDAAELALRVAALEKNAHEPFDFTDLIARLERLEVAVKSLQEDRSVRRSRD